MFQTVGTRIIPLEVPEERWLYTISIIAIDDRPGLQHGGCVYATRMEATKIAKDLLHNWVIDNPGRLARYNMNAERV